VSADGPPAEAAALAQRRAEARAARDFAAADALRGELAAIGWTVRDEPGGGWSLEPRPPYDVVDALSALPDRTAEPDARRLSALLVVDGWPDDLRRCVEALLAHAPADLVVVGLDLGNVDGAGATLHALATEHPGRVEEHHLAGSAGWGPALGALIRADAATYQMVLDPSSVLHGDAVTPLVEALADDPGLAAAGWRGTDVDLGDAWRSFVDAAPGEVDALLGYLLVVRRAAALRTPPSPKARFYRNADMEWSLLLREAGWRLAQPAADLPVTQERHRGYHDSDPAYRDQQSRATYDRLLKRFRGRDELLRPRA
jgi:hypothetical protein